jgi:hypothetical protein
MAVSGNPAPPKLRRAGFFFASVWATDFLPWRAGALLRAWFSVSAGLSGRPSTAPVEFVVMQITRTTMADCSENFKRLLV